MAIDLAVEAPTSMLSDICPLGGIELCFAHLLVGESSPYQMYYRLAQAAGRYVILDNGIMERGVAASVTEMLRLTSEFRPALVTPPEVLHDGRESLRLAKSFANHLRRLATPTGTGMLGVAHGDTFDEWCRCFEGLLSLSEVERIGIPYDVTFDVDTTTDTFGTHLERLVTRRIELCDWVARTYPIVPIHLFGLAHPSELTFQRQHSFVRSLDTSLPVMAASRGIRYDIGSHGPYEKYFLDLSLPHSDTTVEGAQHNIRVMTNAWLSPEVQA